MIDMKSKREVFTSIVLISIVIASTSALAAPAYVVTNGADDGPGTLRDALESGATVILIDESVADIATQSTLFYGGTDPLKIVGAGQTVDGSAHNKTILEISEGADLTISDLSFNGAGNDGGGAGIFVDVPASRTGVVNLKLTDVAVFDVGHHGIYVNDCDAEPCGGGGGGAGNGSEASIHAVIKDVTVFNTGFGAFDSDGLRINDRDGGGIVFESVDSSFASVGADGVELDEGGDGDVIVKVRNNVFEDNGAYCLGASEDDVGDPCWADDGVGNPDLDDGFDIDEAGDGSVLGSVKNVWIIGNLDEGLDLDEEGPGGMDLELVNVNAWGNLDQGIKLSEVEEGGITARLRAVSAVSNGDDGILMEQEDNGDINVTVNGTFTTDNGTAGKDYGLLIDQAGVDVDGSSLMIRGSEFEDGTKSNVPEI